MKRLGTCDINGRPWAKLSELKAGDVVELDSGFTCASAGFRTLKETKDGLAFDCAEGEAAHAIAGQADDGEHCIGIYRADDPGRPVPPHGSGP